MPKRCTSLSRYPSTSSASSSSSLLGLSQSRDPGETAVSLHGRQAMAALRGTPPLRRKEMVMTPFDIISSVTHGPLPTLPGKAFSRPFESFIAKW